LLFHRSPHARVHRAEEIGDLGVELSDELRERLVAYEAESAQAFLGSGLLDGASAIPVRTTTGQGQLESGAD
jgi:hypothetical protein